MSFVPGKVSNPLITGNVDIYEKTASGNKRKVATFKVTCKKLPKNEYEALRESYSEDVDLNLCRELITDIQGAPARDDGSPWPIADLLEAMSQVDMQFDPIVNFVVETNSERIGRYLKAKN